MKKYVNFQTIPDDIVKFRNGYYTSLTDVIDQLQAIKDKYSDDFIGVIASCHWNGGIMLHMAKGETQEDIDKRHEEEDRKERYEQYLELKKEFENDIS